MDGNLATVSFIPIFLWSMDVQIDINFRGQVMNDVNANFEMREVSVKLTSHDRNLSSFPILYDWTPG